MYSKRTVIGIGVGAVMIAIGVIALVTSFGLQTIKVDDTYGIGEKTTYSLTAPDHASQIWDGSAWSPPPGPPTNDEI